MTDNNLDDYQSMTKQQLINKIAELENNIKIKDITLYQLFDLLTKALDLNTSMFNSGGWKRYQEMVRERLKNIIR